MKLKIAQTNEGKRYALPAYQTGGSSGLDLVAVLDAPITLLPLERQLIPTGVLVELPADTEGQIRPRSGLAHKHGLSIVNTPGTIDEDYRGEIKVNLVNLSSKIVSIEPGDRIAQLVICPVLRPTIEAVEVLSETLRGAGGFGSTGTKGAEVAHA